MTTIEILDPSPATTEVAEYRATEAGLAALRAQAQAEHVAKMRAEREAAEAKAKAEQEALDAERARLAAIAAHAGVEPWQLLAPLMGKGRWVVKDVYCTELKGIHGEHVGSVVLAVDGRWMGVSADSFQAVYHPTEAAARAAVEAALFEGVANADQA